MLASKVLVTGAGGFIGWHLVNKLILEGHQVHGVDIKLPQFSPSKAHYFKVLDLRLTSHVDNYFQEYGPFDEVYALAADMGGIGYIENNRADIMRNNVLINCNTLHAAHRTFAGRYLFTSSACVYNTNLQERDHMPTERLHKGKLLIDLKEDDAYPAQCEEGYGWEKLYTEMMCEYYKLEKGLETRVARLHNIYGPYGTYEGGREKAPAALCRKVALGVSAKQGGYKVQSELEIWGDGTQKRTFCYIDDCVEGLIKIMRSDYSEPVNLGSDDVITINELANMIENISGKQLGRRYKHGMPKGVHARSSNNTLLREVTGGWEPQIGYEEGLAKTYEWIEAMIQKKEGSKRWLK